MCSTFHTLFSRCFPIGSFETSDTIIGLLDVKQLDPCYKLSEVQWYIWYFDACMFLHVQVETCSSYNVTLYEIILYRYSKPFFNPMLNLRGLLFLN